MCTYAACSKPGAGRYGSGLCGMHASRQRRGTPMNAAERILYDDEERFWSKVSPASATDCWLWTAATNRHGYGNIRVDGRSRLAHRVAYESLRAEIPAGLELDHLCTVPACVNPWHLEPVTREVNVARADYASNGGDRRSVAWREAR